MASNSNHKRVRYAVIGLGHIAQVAVLPAFKNARNSELVALVSGDKQKRDELGKRYGVSHAVDYDELEELFAAELLDAVYICLPNHLHHEYTIRAAKAGVHVLCEKPLAVTATECREMIEAAQLNDVKLMAAYRLHFEKTNLKAIEIVNSGQIGEPKLFSSVFTMQVKPENIRVDRGKGGGTVYDIGIYCINAARYLFKDEPVAVEAFCTQGADRRFDEIDESTSAILHFPENRLAAFTCSFGAAAVEHYQIVGTKGDLRVDPAYSYTRKMKHFLTVDEKTQTQTFASRDQFGPQLVYFSDCILKDRKPEPSGEEGLIDVQIIEAIYEAARTGRRVDLPEFPHDRRPTSEQEIRREPIEEPELVNADSPHD